MTSLFRSSPSFIFSQLSRGFLGLLPASCQAPCSVLSPPLHLLSSPTPSSSFDGLGLGSTDKDSAGFPFSVPDLLWVRQQASLFHFLSFTGFPQDPSVRSCVQWQLRVTPCSGLKIQWWTCSLVRPALCLLRLLPHLASFRTAQGGPFSPEVSSCHLPPALSFSADFILSSVFFPPSKHPTFRWRAVMPPFLFLSFLWWAFSFQNILSGDLIAKESWSSPLSSTAFSLPKYPSLLWSLCPRVVPQLPLLEGITFCIRVIRIFLRILPLLSPLVPSAVPLPEGFHLKFSLSKRILHRPFEWDQILVGREGDGERGDAEQRSWRGGE